MNKPEYGRLSRNSGKCGDQFYKCLSEWLKDPLDVDQRVSCLTIGHKYEEALREQIEYLKRLDPGPQPYAAIETCMLYYSNLESQLQLLESAFKRGN